MPTYVAVLRGINVDAHNKVARADGRQISRALRNNPTKTGAKEWFLTGELVPAAWRRRRRRGL